jgi:hypothetical protein
MIPSLGQATWEATELDTLSGAVTGSAEESVGAR